MKKLYIGNVAYKTKEEALREAFAAYNSITSVRLITDKFSGQSRGFAFIEFSDDKEAEEAIAAMNDFELDGKKLRISEARPASSNNRMNGGKRRPYRREKREN